MSELKACPFCGGDAYSHRIYSSGGIGADGYYVSCYDCEAEGRFDLDKSGAIELWNTRPIEDALLKRAEAAEARAAEAGWHQVEESMPNDGEMVLVVDVDIVRRGFWEYHGMDVEWRTADNRFIEVYWWCPIPRLPWLKGGEE